MNFTYMEDPRKGCVALSLKRFSPPGGSGITSAAQVSEFLRILKEK